MGNEQYDYQVCNIITSVIGIKYKSSKEIGILEVVKKCAKRYKLNSNDERELALRLIETNEYLRRSNKQELSFKSSEINPQTVKQYSNYNKIEALSLKLTC